MNKYFNTFHTLAEYNAYMAGDVVQYPNYAYIEATDELIKVMEHVPVFSIKVLDGWGDEYSDGATIEGDGEQDYLYVEGYLDGEQILTDDFSVTANNDLVFSDGSTNYQAELPNGYNSTYNYTITATCSGQSVTFNLTYVQPETPVEGYYITVQDQLEYNPVEEGGELYDGMDYWIELKAESGNDPHEPFEGEFVMTCQDSPDFYYEIDRDDDGGVDGEMYFNGGNEGDTITISYVQDGVTLASASYVASVSSGGDYRLVLSTCNPEGDVNNICEAQGFCDDNDYYVILLNRGELVRNIDQFVEYYSIAYDETITPSLDGSGWCVWQCSSFDPSIEEVVCYDGYNNIIATLETSC